MLFLTPLTVSNALKWFSEETKTNRMESQTESISTDAISESSTEPTLATRLSLFLAISVTGLMADLWSKSHMFSELGLPHESNQVEWWVIKDFFGFQTAVNQGALFGIGQGGSSIFALFSVVAFIAILMWRIKGRAWQNLFLTTCLGCITGGVIGNFYDRMGWWHDAEIHPDYAHGVRDFILFTYQDYVWPNFNIADCLLVCGAFMLLIYSFKSEE